MKITSIFLTVFGFVMVLGLQSANAQSRGRIGPAGCGLGNVLVGGKKDVQIIAATLNDISGNQTFGITSGTLNCSTGRDWALLNYIENNKLSLEKDIARGEGETLVALAELSQCDDGAALGSALRGRYQEIFPEPDAHSADIAISIKKVIGSEPSLKRVCPALS